MEFDLSTEVHRLEAEHDMEHDVEALEESAFLLTIAWPGRE